MIMLGFNPWAQEFGHRSLAVIHKEPDSFSTEAEVYRDLLKISSRQQGLFPFLLPTFVSEPTEKTLWMTFPAATYTFLSDILKGQPLQQWQAASLQIARGLMYLHDMGWCHGNIRPASVLYRAADTRAVIVNFGLASRPGKEPETSEHPVIPYTVQYRAPEFWTGEVSSASPVSECWAFGATSLEMVTGAPLFSNISEITEFHLCDKSQTCAKRIAHLQVSSARGVLYGLLQREPKSRMSLPQFLQKCPRDFLVV